ncbi:MAG: 2-dehydro-3-deoxy-6-phosphogalactonate aldolase [Alphaproteobacteria bacterium]|nr:2-dehydro-3-deoxy-6-phosphogalactonate aldolase [Alphaproteobacteria bacterium]
MSAAEKITEHGLIAILRGIAPGEALEIGTALYGAGIRVVEVPLNSPDPFASIARLAAHFAGKMAVGAGTVLNPDQVSELAANGGQFVVAPDTNPAVIGRALKLGLMPLPGVFTPTEAFTAIRSGAAHLKLFPAEAMSPTIVKAWRAVLPAHVRTYAVGGITPANMGPWHLAGCSGFGIGSSIYKPGMRAEDVANSARAFQAAWIALKGEGEITR